MYFYIYNVSFFIYDLTSSFKNICAGRIMRIKKLLIIASAIGVISLCIIGCTPEPVLIESITLSKGIGPDFAPVEPIKDFPSGISELFISIKVNNMTVEDKITVVWNYLETNHELATQDSKEGISGSSGYISFSLKPKNDTSFPSGNYNVLVYLDDQLYETVDFSVK